MCFSTQQIVDIKFYMHEKAIPISVCPTEVTKKTFSKMGLVEAAFKINSLEYNRQSGTLLQLLELHLMDKLSSTNNVACFTV